MIFKSPYPDVAIPDVSVTTYALRRAEELSDTTALVFAPTGESLTYGELADRVRRAAGGLRTRGFDRGDVLCIYSRNTLDYPTAFHAVTWAGGIVTTVNPLYTAEELATQIGDSGARIMLTESAFLDKARAAAEQVGVETIYTFDGAEGTLPFTDLLSAEPLMDQVPVLPGDLAALPYSSGTTGVSKGVMLTHHNLVANMCQLEGTESLCKVLTEDDCIIAVLPFFHIYGLLVIMNHALAMGARIVVFPRFELEPFLAAIQEHRVTFAHLVPPIVLALGKHPLVDTYDLSSMWGIMSGAAPLGEELASAVQKRLGCVVAQGYGLTETSPVTHTAPNKEPRLDKQASIGPAIPNTEVMIVDTATGEPMGTGKRGEVWIRGPQVMAGYLGRPEATKETIDEEGFLHTGDVGYVDDEGWCYIVDRVKELIKYKGFQVPPAELEALLLTHESIRDVAVVRSPDEEAGEIPKAFVVSDGSLSEEDVMRFVAEHVAPHKKVRLVEFVDEIPKSASGKILRRILVAREEERVRAQGGGS